MAMQIYKELLSFQPMLDQDIVELVDKLLSGDLTKTQFHNRKSYSKGKGDLISVLKYSIAFEVSNMVGKHER